MILTNLLDTPSAGVQDLPLSLGSAQHRGLPRLSLPPAVAERIPSLHLVERGPIRGHVLCSPHTKLQWSVKYRASHHHHYLVVGWLASIAENIRTNNLILKLAQCQRGGDYELSSSISGPKS